MNRALAWLIPAVALVLAAAVFLIHRSSQTAPQRTSQIQSVPEVPPEATKPAETPKKAEKKLAKSTQPPSKARSAFERVLEALRSGDREKIRKTLAEMLGELTPAPVPDAENAALLYKEAFAKFVVATSEEEEARISLFEGKTLTPGQTALLQSYLEKNRETLRLLHEAADRPRCNFNLDYSKGFDLELPHVSQIIRSSRLLQVESLLSGGEAVGEVGRVSSRLAGALSDEPILVSQLVRYVCQGMVSTNIDRALDAGPSEATLRTLIGALSPDKIRGGLERAALGELYMGVKFVIDGGDPGAYGLEGAPRRPDDPMTQHDLTYYAETLEQYSNLVSRPYFESREGLELLAKTREEGAPWYAEISKMLLPAMKRSAENEAQAEASAAAMQMASAAKLYRALNGSYPASLEDLRTLLPDLPLDPYTGKSFIYERTASGFALYSNGPDGNWDWNQSKTRGIGFRTDK